MTAVKQQPDNSGLAQTKSGDTLIGQASEEQIAQWKKDNPNGVYGIKKDGHIGYVKDPSRGEMNCAMSKASADAAFDMFEELAELTWLGGSEELKRNDRLFRYMVKQLREIIEGEKVELVKF